MTERSVSFRLEDMTEPEFSNLVELLRRRALRQPERRAYTFLADGEAEEVHLTYGELDRQARAIAAILQDLNAAGERALLLYPPGLDYIAAFFGCLYAGVIAVPVYPPDPVRLNRTLPRLQTIARDARAKIALTTGAILEMRDLLWNQAEDLRALHWLATDHAAKETAGSWKEPLVTRDSIAFLQYTSGSTASPKGVMISHSNLLNNLLLIRLVTETSSESQMVSWLPQYHDMGLITGILLPCYDGFPVTLMSPLDFLQKPFRWLQAVSRTRTTHSGGPNFAYDLCVRKIADAQKETLDLSRWEVAFNGAETVRHETMRRFLDAFARCGFRYESFMPCYGLAEATVGVSWNQKDAPPTTLEVDAGGRRQTLVGCGMEPQNHKIMIVDPETLIRCPTGQVGEIWVSGPSVGQGYWNRPQETEETFKAFIKETGEGPFLRTGDLGFLKDGELFVTGRIKDLLIIGGQNHYPQDIEQTVEQSHPSIRPGCCAAFAVDIDGEERLVIAVEVDGSRSSLDMETVIGDIKQTVAQEHGLTVYKIVPLKTKSLPKTSSGKIQRYACKKGFLSESLEVM